METTQGNKTTLSFKKKGSLDILQSTMVDTFIKPIIRKGFFSRKHYYGEIEKRVDSLNHFEWMLNNMKEFNTIKTDSNEPVLWRDIDHQSIEIKTEQVDLLVEIKDHTGDDGL